jgi:hypothetical protein
MYRYRYRCTYYYHIYMMIVIGGEMLSRTVTMASEPVNSQPRSHQPEAIWRLEHTDIERICNDLFAG